MDEVACRVVSAEIIEEVAVYLGQVPAFRLLDTADLRELASNVEIDFSPAGTAILGRGGPSERVPQDRGLGRGQGVPDRRRRRRSRGRLPLRGRRNRLPLAFQRRAVAGQRGGSRGHALLPDPPGAFPRTARAAARCPRVLHPHIHRHLHGQALQRSARRQPRQGWPRAVDVLDPRWRSRQTGSGHRSAARFNSRCRPGHVEQPRQLAGHFIGRTTHPSASSPTATFATRLPTRPSTARSPSKRS